MLLVKFKFGGGIMFYKNNVLRRQCLKFKIQSKSTSTDQAPSDGNQLEGANMIKIPRDANDIIISQD